MTLNAKMTFKKTLMLTGGSLLMVANVYAMNLQYLKYSPVSEFSDSDFELLQTTGRAAIVANKDGETSEWHNPETSHSGSITPLNTTTIDGMKCRKTTIKNQSKNHTGESTFTFCEVDGKWKLLK